MNQNNYDLYRPLMRCKDGDFVSISVESGNKKDIPAGVYLSLIHISNRAGRISGNHTIPGLGRMEQVAA